MRTQVMHEPAIGTPWLERDSNDGPIEKTPIMSFPFRIGRNDTSDLHIDSNQVSREHCVLTRQGKKYRVQDLGSTNGTFINGERISDATLNDGDLLGIAEVEFTFYCGGQETSRQTATQVMHHEPAAAGKRDAAWELILGVRRAHEVAVQRAFRAAFQPVIELASGEPFAYEAFASSGAEGAADPRCEQLLAGPECRATDRARRLFRRLAVESSASLPPSGRLMVAVTAAEAAAPWLLDHLLQLRDALGTGRTLVVEIPDSAVRTSAEFSHLRGSLRDAGIEVAYDGYASSKAQITEREQIAPDFLKLAPSLVRSIHRGEDRQRQVQLIVSTSHELGCSVIAAGIDNDSDLRVCREMGCGLAQGDFWGKPRSTNTLIRAARAANRAGI